MTSESHHSLFFDNVEDDPLTNKNIFQNEYPQESSFFNVKTILFLVYILYIQAPY